MKEDILLEGEEKIKILDLLNKTPFESFEVHPHYYDTNNLPRHGVSIKKAKEVYYQFDKISVIYKRQGVNGCKYAVVYKFSKHLAYYLLFFLDETPMKLFNAYVENNAEERLRKKFFSG